MALLGAGLAGALADFIGLLGGVSAPDMCIQDDFRSYFYGAKAIASGISPYDVEAIREAFGVEAHFVYPWFMTAPFRLLLPLGFEKAQLAFLLIKLVASVALVGVGHKTWAEDHPFPAWLIFFAVAINGTWLRDVCLGNAVVFETLLLWIGFALLLGRHVFWFCLAVALASVNKLAYIGLLAAAPLLYPRWRLAWLAVAATLVVIAALLALGWLSDPNLMEQWYRSFRPIFGFRYNWFNFGKFFFELQGVGDAQPPYWRRGESYVAAVAVGIVWSAACLAYGRQWRSGLAPPPLRMLALFILAFAATIPFAFSYSWIYALGAAFIAITAALPRGGAWSVAALLVLGVALVPRALWLMAGIALPYNYIHLFSATAASLLISALSIAESRAAHLRTNIQ